MTTETSTKELPSEILVWIYEDDTLVNLDDAPYGEGDLNAIEEGLERLITCSKKWKSRKNVQSELLLDITEEGAGTVTCTEYGDNASFPEKWYVSEMNKRHVINDPIKMDPILANNSNPWKYRVEVIFTDKDAPPPPQSLLSEEAIVTKNEKIKEDVKIIEHAMADLNFLGIVSTKNKSAIQDILVGIIKQVRKND